MKFTFESPNRLPFRRWRHVCSVGLMIMRPRALQALSGSVVATPRVALVRELYDYAPLLGTVMLVVASIPGPVRTMGVPTLVPMLQSPLLMCLALIALVTNPLAPMLVPLRLRSVLCPLHLVTHPLLTRTMLGVLPVVIRAVSPL